VITAWLWLAASICLELTGSTWLRLSEGFEKLHYGLGALAVFGLSLYCVSRTFNVIPAAVAYTVWSGVGILAMCLISMRLFDEQFPWLKILFIALILIGTIGLTLTTKPIGN